MKPLNEMTAEELIAYTEDHAFIGDKQLTDLIYALRNKLKEAITPNPDEIHIVWSIEDVYSLAAEDEVIPTLEQAREVLRRIEGNHDSSNGVSWQDIEDILVDVLEGR